MFHDLRTQVKGTRHVVVVPASMRAVGLQRQGAGNLNYRVPYLYTGRSQKVCQSQHPKYVR